VKTISLKKVAAVAATSLVFAGVSAVPAFALTDLGTTTPSVTKVTSASIASNTLLVGKTYSTGEAITATINVLSANGMIATGDGVTVTVAITGPAIATPTGTAAAINSTVAVVAAPAATALHAVDAAATTASASHTCSKTWVSGAPVATVVELCTVTFTPTMPGVYTIGTSALATGATPGPVAVNKSIGVGAVDVLSATVGTSITALNAAGAQAGGYATFLWMPVGPNTATTTYFASVDNGSIVTAVASAASGTTGTVTPATSFTNGVNSTDGFKAVYTLAGTYDSGGAAGTGINPASVLFTVTNPAAVTQVLTIKSLNATTGAIAKVASATITYGTLPLPSAQYSLLGLNAGATFAITTAASDTTATTVATTAGTQRFTIAVTVMDQFNAAYSGVVVGASITGPGTLGADTTVDGSSASLGRSITSTWADNIGEVTVFSDGSAGTGVITITATTALGVTTILGTKTVKFAGSPAKATVTQNLYVAKAGTQLGVSPSATAGTNLAATVAATPAFYAQVTDTNGVDAVAGSVVKMTSSDVTIITVGSCVETTIANVAAPTTYPAAPGNFECSVSGAAGAASGKSATVTFSVYSSTTGLYSIVATPITFTIGGSIAKSVVSTDKASYTAGEAVNLTATSTDSSGNKAYDGQTPYTSISSNKGFGGTNGGLALTGKEIKNGKYSTTSSTGVASVFAPSTPGSFTISGLYTDAATGTAYSATGSVVDGNAALLTQIDALNAKIVALNALIAKIMKKLGVK
jgi:hypothetical protein